MVATKKVPKLNLPFETIHCSSAYTRSQTSELKVSYEQKLLAVNMSDPYLLQNSDFDTLPEDWPEVTYANIYNFIVTSHSTFTHSEVKAYKSLVAYEFVITGQIFDVNNCKQIQPLLYLFLHQFGHSQSIFTKRPIKLG